MSKQREVERALSVSPRLCDCGCGNVNVILIDWDGEEFAYFQLSKEDWVPFAEDCVRMCEGQAPLGQPDQRVAH